MFGVAMAVPNGSLHLEQSRASSVVVNGNGNERNGNGYHRIVTPKFKRRKVSAVRHFPPGCGRFAARINSGATEGGNNVDGIKSEDKTAKISDALNGQCVETGITNNCEAMGVSQGLPVGALQTLESAVELEQMDSVEDKNEKLEIVTREEEEPSAKELDTTGPNKYEEFSKPDLTDVLLQEMPGVDLSGSKKDTIQSDNSLAFPAKTFLERTNTRQYPPRRRVSAVREFPPFCGRNAPILRKEECTSKNEVMGDEKPIKDREALIDKGVIDAEKKEEAFRSRHSQKGEVDGNALSGGEDAIQAEPLAIVYWEKEDGLELRPEMKTAEEDAEPTGSPKGGNLNEISLSDEMAENRDFVDLEKPTGKEMVIYKKVKINKRKHSDVLRRETRSLDKDDESNHPSGRATVLGVMASPNSPWKNWNNDNELSREDGATESKGKKQRAKPISAPRKMKTVGEGSSRDKSKNLNKALVLYEEPSNKNTGQMVVWDPDDSSEHEEQADDFYISVRPRFSVNPPPFGHPSLGSEVDYKTEAVTRNKVRETLRLFQAVCRKLLQEEEAKTKKEDKRSRVDLPAAKILKEKGRFVNVGKPIIGNVPGVEVGDEFQYRVELNIIGLHRALQAGIDYVKHGDRILAASIVSSGAYSDVLEHSDFLIYTGSGGNLIGKDKEPEDQKLERGNLALSNSISAKNPVRVIRGLRETRASESSDAKNRSSILYTYDGMYLVEKCWREAGKHGKLVFKFRLNRIPGQPELAWKKVKKSKKYEAREGLCVADISQGKEIMPIGAVNTIDDEKPPKFKYITQVIYPDWCRRLPPMGCDCCGECSDSEKCACAVKNGGEIPYNYNGAIVEARPLVYECGPSCKCPPSCHNRVTQRGIRIPLEIFKTESRGWGVRCLNSISSGSFICEYVGELLDDKQAEERTGNDEYLFDIGNKYNDNNMREELESVIPDAHSVSVEEVEEVGFTIDAASYGNVGRFINHSCSPNLYAQNVLYDYDDKRIPHIMFFAAENIPPLQELTYHYNYTIDQVRDSDGNIKMKSCFCGTSECMGRMY